MPPEPLTVPARATLALADSTHILASLGRFSGAVATTWVDPASSRPDSRFARNQNFGALPAPEVVEAIAVRGPLHCIDGWGYLARAVGALSAGDGHAARHLAYYAELRGALSILATQGIGNFNSKNVVVDIHGAIHAAPDRQTHEFSWLALENWAQSPGAFEKISRSLDVNGVSLLDALKAFFPSPSSAMLGSELIREWGFDLSQSHVERESRNDSSYQPNELVSVRTAAPDDILFLRQFWQAFEPDTYRLERFLLRKMLESQATLLNVNLLGRGTEFQRLDARVHDVLSIDFIERRSEPDDHAILALARNPVAGAHEMIARGALLLRIATGLVESNFKAALVDPTADLEFWWALYGVERGFWATSSPPDEMALLWADIAEALQDAEAAPAAERFDWLARSPLGLPRTCEAERIGLWSLCR